MPPGCTTNMLRRVRCFSSRNKFDYNMYSISIGRQYVTDYECTNTIDGQWFVRDASKSFPSGHSSTAFYEAIFLIWYLQARSPCIRSKLLIPTVQSILLLLALLCSVSRITDHRHHWWDVLAGAKIGILFASLTVSNTRLFLYRVPLLLLLQFYLSILLAETLFASANAYLIFLPFFS